MNIACQFRNDSIFGQVEPVLSRAGYVCERFTTDTALQRAVLRRDFDFILIEMGEHVHDREHILSWLSCRTGDSVPVILLSSVGGTELVVNALHSGADDFVVSPVAPLELAARIHAILRRTNRRQARRTIELAGFTIDRDANACAYEGNPVELTPREFTMAWLLFSAPGEYISRETISSTIWGTGSEIAGRTIEQHVYKLRKKLQLGPERGILIRTAYNQGYRLELCK
jgi:DNA-binding response OmpR family regulator